MLLQFNNLRLSVVHGLPASCGLRPFVSDWMRPAIRFPSLVFLALAPEALRGDAGASVKHGSLSLQGGMYCGKLRAFTTTFSPVLPVFTHEHKYAPVHPPRVAPPVSSRLVCFSAVPRAARGDASQATAFACLNSTSWIVACLTCVALRSTAVS